MIATAIPGASFVITALVASGVTSLSEKPVPPVVKIRSNFMTSAHITRTSFIFSASSGVHCRMVTVPFIKVFDCTNSTRLWPLVSVASDRKHLSLTVRIPVRIVPPPSCSRSMIDAKTQLSREIG
uniref:Putative secreted protein n=1 Tax=Ixodes ricinus TaxID=34613 RepID=A0A6B0UPL6_IXORI